ncbi:MAG: hypothetical protein LBQ77_06670, partial [Treponema sp.]|nr:hypothetical protein [Treponema sp.]
EYSNFYYYFVSNFAEFGLKKLITTHFEVDKPSYKFEYEGGAEVRGDKEVVIQRAIKLGRKTPLKQNYEQGSQTDLFDKEPMRSYRPLNQNRFPTTGTDLLGDCPPRPIKGQK